MEKRRLILVGVLGGIAIAVVIFVGVILLCPALLDSQQGISISPNTPGMIACPMDALLCPDGSSVSRVGPHCEFAPCPDGSAVTEPPMGIPERDMCPPQTKRCPDGTRVFRGGPDCVYAPCPTPSATGSISDTSGMYACPMDAKLCSDGSSVARSGQKCEFAPCPRENRQ